jgi:glycosyltransferase involved in cell wall biosynthesis
MLVPCTDSLDSSGSNSMDIPRPVILVAGHVSERIDWDGIRAASQARPEWTWLFVGPADPGLPEKIAAFGRACAFGTFSKSSPFLWKAPVAVEQMPALIAHCDACAVPYRLNSFTFASSPLKAIEYLAMGSPVLSTRIPALRHCGAAIQWAEQGDGESYARALDKLKFEQRNSSFIEIRRSAVSGDSHESRVDHFLQIVLKEN